MILSDANGGPWVYPARPGTDPVLAKPGPLYTRILAAVEAEPYSTAADIARTVGERVDTVAAMLERLAARGKLRRFGTAARAYTYRVPR